MQNWSHIAHAAKDILTVCLAKGIDQALTTQQGEDWFQKFLEADALEKPTAQITKNGQRSVRDLDLQALLKILRFRRNLTQKVLSYYGYFSDFDSFSAEGQMQQMTNLLDRLINDFRNRIEAHARAADIEKELSGEGVDRIYGYEEAYQDMYKLTRIFGTVTDSNGIPYAQHMAALTEPQPKPRKRWPLFAGIAAALALVIGLTLWLLPGKSANAYRDEREPEVVKDEVVMQPIQVYYDGEELVAECYLVNGTDEKVSEIDVYSFRIMAGGREIAAADFGTISKLKLKPGDSIQWQFRFPKETIFVHNAKLTDLNIEFHCTPS
jgi:SLAP domain-containing protein